MKNYLNDYQCTETLELKELLEQMYFPQLSGKYPQINERIKELKEIFRFIYQKEFNNDNTPWETYTTKGGKMKYKWGKNK